MRRFRSAVLPLMRLILGVVLILAGSGKMGQPVAVAAIGRYLAEVSRTLAASVNPLLPLLPGVEVVAGVLLLWGVCTRWNALVTTTLLAGFIGVLLAAWARGVPLQGCGCFGGAGAHASYPLLIGRDLLLLLCAGALSFRGGGPLSLDVHLRRKGARFGTGAAWLALPMASVALIVVLAGRPERRPAVAPSTVTRISGTVVDSGGSPVAGAWLLDDEDRVLGRSDGLGRFEVRPGRPIERIRARAPGSDSGGALGIVELPQVMTRGDGVTEYDLTLRLPGTSADR